MKDLLKKWINGSGTWSEEQQLRQAAEKDHFLAEAMEGYDAFPITDHAAKIEQLKGRFRKPAKSEKGLVISFSRVAAAAAIIGVIGTFFWVQREIEQPAIFSQQMEQLEVFPPLQNKDENTEIAEVTVDNPRDGQSAEASKKELPKPSNQPTTKLKTPAAKPIIKDTKNDRNIGIEDNTDLATASIKDIAETEAIASVPLAETSVIAPTTRNAASPATESTIAIIENSIPESVPTPAPAVDIATSYSAPAASIRKEKQVYARESVARKKEVPKLKKINYYVGQVRNEDGQPMNAVKIVGLNTPFSTVSAINGEFTLETDIPLTKIAVSKDGFHTRKIAISQYSDFLNVNLDRKSTKLPANAVNGEIETVSPRPIAGFKDFFKYLEANRIYPTDAKGKGIERDVEIRFYIDKHGTPTQLKVTNPDAHGFDKEAIRLLENGPKWMPLNSHARYYVPFELR